MFHIYRRKKNKLANSEGQVAIEFILMFILVAFIVFYIWNLCIGIAALQLREYATFMVGRAVTASYKTYDEKKQSAENVMGMYNSGNGFVASAGVASKISCDINNSGNRGLYSNKGNVDWFTVSDVGVACSMTVKGIMPMGEALNLVSESMTWSEISDEHCECALQFDQTWKKCADGSSPSTKFIDNGC